MGSAVLQDLFKVGPFRMSFKILFPLAFSGVADQKVPISHPRWALFSYKWGYNPYKWPYKWVTEVIGVITHLVGKMPDLSCQPKASSSWRLLFRPWMKVWEDICSSGQVSGGQNPVPTGVVVVLDHHLEKPL